MINFDKLFSSAELHISEQNNIAERRLQAAVRQGIWQTPQVGKHPQLAAYTKRHLQVFSKIFEIYIPKAFASFLVDF